MDNNPRKEINDGDVAQEHNNLDANTKEQYSDDETKNADSEVFNSGYIQHEERIKKNDAAIQDNSPYHDPGFTISKGEIFQKTCTNIENMKNAKINQTSNFSIDEIKQANYDLKLQLDLSEVQNNLLITQLSEYNLLREKLTNELTYKDILLSSTENDLKDYRTAFDALREWHISLNKKYINEKNENLKLMSDISFLKEKLQIILSERNLSYQQNDEYEEIVETTRLLIEEQNHIKKLLNSKILDTERELATYVDAWNQLKLHIADRESKYKSKISSLIAENVELKEKNKQMELLTVPRWQKHVVELNDNNVRVKRMQSSAAIKLQARISKSESCLSSELMKNLITCLPDKIQITIHVTMIALSFLNI